MTVTQYEVVIWLIALLAFAWWLFLYRKYGKSYAVKPHGEQTTVPSNHPPVVLSYLIFNQRITPDMVPATIIDLANRGYLGIEEITTEKMRMLRKNLFLHDYRFIRGTQHTGTLEDFERNLIDFFMGSFGDGNEFRLSRVMNAVSKHDRRLLKWFETWKKLVRQRCWWFRFYEESRNDWSIFVVKLLGYIVAPLGLLLVIMTHSPLIGLPVIVIGGILSTASTAIRRLRPEAEELLSNWGAYSNHLKAISISSEPVRLSSYDWGRIVSTSIVLGMYKKLLPKLVIVDENGRICAPEWYFNEGATSFELSGFVASFTGLLDSMSSAMSSSTARTDGGTSDGGGGGGGGDG